DLPFMEFREEFATAQTPEGLAEELDKRAAAEHRPEIWIARLGREALLRQTRKLFAAREAGRALPLFGLPLAVKDNIDVAGVPTTAGCPSFAYMPSVNAPVVERLIAAGAVVVGKNNMDQFATGLVGSRSPYGAVRNFYDPEYISGGSSSGSAL